MKFKSAFAAIAATTALTGAVFLAETVQAKPCIFSQPNQATDGAPPSAPTEPTTTQADLGKFNKLGIVGGSLALFGGFLAGGVMLKRRLDRTAPLTEAAPAEALSDQVLLDQVLPDQVSEPLFAPSDFAIEIPPAVLESIRETEAPKSELNSAR